MATNSQQQSFDLRVLAYPGVVSLVTFLAYSSQYLFTKIEPGPLSVTDAYTFNILVAFLLICYTRTCFKDPGTVPRDWHETSSVNGSTLRYCRRCDQPKAPRSHHCKTCKRCVPKMDHHCIWTANCISHITFPHFIRFLFYAVAAMIQLEYFLYLRCAMVWHNRRLPSYLGPSATELAHLFILVVTNSLVLLSLSIMFGKTLWDLASNITTIEAWEIERHHANVRRAKALGGYLYGPDGSIVRIQRQEYPWDIGILRNTRQGMGTWNPLAWLSPFARSPRLQDGLSFEHNEIEDPSKPWPPPDPDRMFRSLSRPEAADPFRHPMDVDSFKARQAADLRRRQTEGIVRRKTFAERYAESDDQAIMDSEEDDSDHHAGEGEQSWTNRDGERLADFGVDEDIEFYDEDDVPLVELIRRKQSGRES